MFAIAWRRRDALPAAPEDRLWLFGIARRVLANAARAERRRHRLIERLKAEPAIAHVEPAGLAQALAALAASDRELLLLTGWEGLTPDEIGRVLQRPAALVSRRLYRARKRLAAELAGSGIPTPVEPK